jgi:hypothetical protein
MMLKLSVAHITSAFYLPAARIRRVAGDCHNPSSSCDYMITRLHLRSLYIKRRTVKKVGVPYLVRAPTCTRAQLVALSVIAACHVEDQTPNVQPQGMHLWSG